MMDILTINHAAIIWFLACWLGFSWLVDKSRWHKVSLSFYMNGQRRQWMAVMATRKMRMVDTAIMASLQQGTAFFASISIFAIGGSAALLGSADEIARLYQDIWSMADTSRIELELKLIGLILIYSYALFKFGWAYRLFNYCSIMIGAVPEVGEDNNITSDKTNASDLASLPPREDAHHSGDINAQLTRAATLNILGGKHFNAGLRAVFFSLGYLGWFGGPLIFIASTTLVFLTLIRRQFFSRAKDAVSG